MKALDGAWGSNLRRKEIRWIVLQYFFVGLHRAGKFSFKKDFVGFGSELE